MKLVLMELQGGYTGVIKCSDEPVGLHTTAPFIVLGEEDGHRLAGAGVVTSRLSRAV